MQTGQTDFSATVTKVTSSGADAVFYGGYYAEAGLLVKQLRQAGYKGLFMSGDGSEDPAFVKAAGAAGRQRCGADRSGRSGARRLRQQVPRRSSAAPSGLYSTQAYDATNIFLAGLDAGQDAAPPT